MSTLSISSENGIKKEFLLPKSASLSQSVEFQCSDIEEVNCTVALCRCQQSKNFPLCDNVSHHKFNKETNSNIFPVIVDMNGSKLVVGTIKKKKRLSTSSSTEIQRDSIDVEPKQTESTSNEVDTQSKDNNTNIPPTIQVESMKTSELIENNTNTSTDSKPVKKELLVKKVDKSKITAVYSKQEVAQHNTQDDCWMIINGHVYDITTYFPHHPGGTRSLLKFAGKDGTENVQFHSGKMMHLLDTYFYIGRLEGTPAPKNCLIM